GAGRRAAHHPGQPPPGWWPGRAPAQRDLAQGGRDGGRGRGRRADRQHQPRRRPGGGARRAVGGAPDPGGGRGVELPARPDPIRPVHVRDRRQRRGGPAGRHQPEPDPGPRVRADRTDRGIMGIIYASELGSVSSNVNGGQNVLYAVAAAVIGGVSLFGGRGKMLGAVLGGLIVAVIYNGLQLLGLGAAPQAIWTAVVLLAAVTVDTVARRSQTSR